MVRLNFKKCYEKFINNGEKRTTVRVGDKTKRFHRGQMVDLTVGSRYKPRILFTTHISHVEALPFCNILDEDLKEESPDCRTVDGLWCTMFHINKVLLEPNDVVTIIHWI